MIVVKLPWPDKVLNPNTKVHWAVEHRAFQKAKKAAFWATKEVLSGPLNPPYYIRVTYHPKTRNYPDRDNFIASQKAAQDGIALALGVDDSHFEPVYNDGEPIKGGCVVWQIQEAEE